MPPRRIKISLLVYWVAVLSLCAWAAWLRFSLPLDPVADPDTWGYLFPALSMLLGSGFVHNGRNFVYPAFLFLLLRVLGDFRAITIAQHLFGLLAGGVLLVTWRRLRVFVPSSRLSHVLHNGVGLIAAAILCLEVAIINSLEVPRYLTVQFFFTLVAELLAAGLLLQTLGQLRSRSRLSAG